MKNYKVGYNYKIQWAFAANQQGVKNCKQLIKAIGARSLTVINFRNENGKTITNYSGMVQYPFGLSESETIKHISKTVKQFPEISEIELLRR